MQEPIESDEAIASRVQSGDGEAFGILMERYQSKLGRYGRGFLKSEDDIAEVVQDVFVNAYRNIKGFDARKRFSPWIYRIAHNAFANELRRRSRHPFALPDFDTLLAHTVAPERAEDEAERREWKELAARALGMVSSVHQEILSLFFLEELSYKEIADVLRIPVGSVGVRLSRAKRALRAALPAVPPPL